jgi:hypothetical protein
VNFQPERVASHSPIASPTMIVKRCSKTYNPRRLVPAQGARLSEFCRAMSTARDWPNAGSSD